MKSLSPTRFRAAAWLFPLLFVAGGCQKPAPPPPDAPRLVLFLVVDQMRADYLERFQPLWTGGFARLLAESNDFVAAYHEHAVTTTSPGHTTLATGLFPSHHGVIDNNWYDAREKDEVYAVEDEEGTLSPRRLLGTGLTQWLKARYPSSRAFSFSGKDRAAILMGGPQVDGAFWFDRKKGGFGSSKFYRLAKPSWLKDLNRNRPAAAAFGQPWQPCEAAAKVLADPAERARFGIVEPSHGAFAAGFPHAVGGFSSGPDSDYYNALYTTPRIDELTGEAAAAALKAEKLGQGPTPDVLFVSFTAVDTVGHAYGPASPEVLDTLLRLDAVLGHLLEAVDSAVGLDHVVISLSADHGVVPLPEAEAAAGRPAHRLTAQELSCFQGVEARLEKRWGEGPWLNEFWVLDAKALAKKGLAAAEAQKGVAEELATCPGVARVWTRAELATPAAEADPRGRLFARSLAPGRGPDVMIDWQPGFLALLGTGTTHGTPAVEDSHVPWLLRLPGGHGQKLEERVATVDVAPTLASLTGVPIPPDRDGQDRSALLRKK